MDDDSILSRATLDANSRFIVPFGVRKFRQRIFFPSQVLRVLPVLTQAIVSLHSKTSPLAAVLQTLSDLQASDGKKADGTPSRFSASLDSISSQLQIADDAAKYTWELASDLTLFYRELLVFVDGSLSLLGKTDDFVKRELAVTVPRHIEAIGRGKPPNARETVHVSLNIGTPEVMKQYEQYAISQGNHVKKCDCGEPATWFTFPCSHPVSCDECLAKPPAQCQMCDAAVEKLVQIQLPEE